MIQEAAATNRSFLSFPFLPSEMAFLRKKTAHGHVMAEVYSCLQKAVRRGDADEALYWGAQIGEPFPNALKKRLMQHALEDVCAPEYARALMGAKAKTWVALVPWVRALCAVRKSRAAAWMNRVAVQYIADPAAAPTPLLGAAALALVQHRDGQLTALGARFGASTMRVYKELNNEVLVFHCMLLVEAGIVTEDAYALGAATTDDVDLATVRTVPDYALDKHTARGKALGRGYAHFLETMVVAPRLFPADAGDPFELEARALYTDGKEQRVRHILAASVAAAAKPAKPPKEPKAAKPPKEPKAAKPVAGTTVPAGFTDVLQAQLLTGKHKPRVWFATDADGAQVVVKGPVKAAERAAVMQTEALKVRLGLPHTHMRTHGEYLVCDSLLDYKTLETRVVSSTLETDVRVPIFTGGWDHAMLADDDSAAQLFLGLLLRKVAGANDTCTRNFIVAGGKVYSIDDAALGKTTTHMWKKPLMKQAPAYAAALARVWTRVEAAMAVWRGLLAADAFAMAQLTAHATPAGWKW